MIFAVILGLAVLPAQAGQRGFRLYRSSTSGMYTYGATEAVASTTRWKRTLTYNNPDAGTWYFVVTAWAEASTYYGGSYEYESEPSNEVIAMLAAGETITFAWDEFSWSFQRIQMSVESVGQITGGGAGSISLQK